MRSLPPLPDAGRLAADLGESVAVVFSSNVSGKQRKLCLLSAGTDSKCLEVIFSLSEGTAKLA